MTNKTLNQTRLFFVLGALFFLLTSCSYDNLKKDLFSKSSKESTSGARYPGHYKSGGAYTIKGKKYHPLQKVNWFKQTGHASWYGNQDHGKPTANGDRFDQSLFTAAHRTLPLPCIVHVTNLENGKKLIVMVNDRGPYAHDRILDLSKHAAEILDVKHKGHAKVRVQYLSRETRQLLNKVQLEPVRYSKTKGNILDPECSVGRYIKKLNIKHRLL